MGEAGKMAAKQTFDVALWQSWPSLFPEQIGLVEASGSYAAVASFMERCGVEKVAYAAACYVGQARADRWTHLYLPLDRREKRRR